MRKFLGIILGCAIVMTAGVVFAQEHGGEAVAPEAAVAAAVTDGAAVAAIPAAEDIRKAISDYVAVKSGEAATFTIDDPETKTTRELTFDKVHERVGKTGDLYYSCADFTDKASGEKLDLDFDVEAAEGKLNVVDTRIHKVSDVARYTYDENDNRIPLAAPAAEGTQEHGGQEHGGQEHGGAGM